MKYSVFKRSGINAAGGFLAAVSAVAALLTLVLYGLGEAGDAARSQGLRLLREGLNNAVVRCYVTEGSYPESIGYIEERYGVFVDRDSYVVHYEIFAPNIMPNIIVRERAGGDSR